MKILVVGKCRNNLNYINQCAEESNSDLVICPSGVGILHQHQNDKKHNGAFYEYLKRKKHFIRPTISLIAPYDNWELAKNILQKDLEIPNFYLLGRNNESIDTLYTALRGITVSGIGGTYSPTSYCQDQTTGSHKRHYRKKDILNLQRFHSHILLMYDIMGDCSKNKIEFDNDTLLMFRDIKPLYTFVGKYDWFGCASLEHHNVMTMPAINKGYLVIDTEKEWDANYVAPTIAVK